MTDHPVCPVCHIEMVPIRIQCEDASGWTFGWACECDEALRAAQDDGFYEVIVHSGVAQAIVASVFEGDGQ